MRPKRNKRGNAPAPREASEQTWPAEAGTTLLPFLLERLKGLSRTRIKSMLAAGQIRVNDEATTRFDHPLEAGDRVTADHRKKAPPFRHPLLRIVYEDNELIVVNKSHGLLTVANDRERNRTAYRILSDYVKRADPRNRIFILHRLDKDTSGLLVFAKNPEVQESMQRNWNELVRDRRYVAVAEGKLPEAEGTLTSSLAENSVHKMYASRGADAVTACTRYRVLAGNGRYSLVELSLETGRKNQIRAHLEELGNSIAGDRKYGAQSSPLGRMALHACILEFVHPVTRKKLRFETPIPSRFRQIVRSAE